MDLYTGLTLQKTGIIMVESSSGVREEDIGMNQTGETIDQAATQFFKTLHPFCKNLSWLSLNPNRLSDMQKHLLLSYLELMKTGIEESIGLLQDR